MRLVPGNSPPVAESTPPATRKRLPATKKRLSASRKRPLATIKRPPANKPHCRQPEKDRRQPKHPGWPPETNRLVSKRSAGAPRWSAGRPLCKYSDCGLLELVAVHGDEELLVIDCLLQSVLHKFHSLYAIHIRQVVAQYPYSVYILRTVEKIISTGRT